MLIINENQIDEWVRANARNAQGLIVELVWRLVAASCPKPQERRFPLADSIGQHGPDGILDTVLGFDPFVPDGRSLWEIGTGLNARDKAIEDYNGLTAAIPEHIRKDSTFVFVTPLSARRNWEYTWKENAQARWIEERRGRGEWKDIRVIDGTKLIDWIHHFPAIELWLAEKIIPGLPANQIETLEQRWEILKSTGEPPSLTPDVFLANRAEACEKLKELLDRTITQLKLTTHFPDQIVNFVSAYVASLDVEAQKEAVTHCLVVKGVEAWDTLCHQRNKLILIADASLDLVGETGTRLIQKALGAGHAVVFGGPQGGIPTPTSVPLPNPSVYQVQKALQKAGYNEERARTLVQRSGGNLGSLLRCMQNLSLLPEWAKISDAADLAIALLLGAWRDSSEADCKVAEDLSGKPYEEWIGKMREIALRPDTPLIHQDGNWKFISRYEGWYALGLRLFDEHLNRFKAIAVSVLREPDPQFELEPEKRYLASIYGKVLKHSHLLRNGIAESLALLGSHPQALKFCRSEKAEATAILAVREILADADWVRWASLNDRMPLLAEAAPSEFLDSIEEALRKDPCPFDKLFAQETGGITGRTYIPGLLWALETLAWDEQYLVQSCVALAELASRDPGGQWANRPANSLATILLPWLPQTLASIEKRKVAVKTILNEQPDIGWNLIIQLLPHQHQISSMAHKPIWRKTIPDDWKEGVTNQEYWQQVSFYADLAVTAAVQDAARLSTLIDHFDKLPQAAFDQLLQTLASEPIAELPKEQRLLIWNHLTRFTNKHRRFSLAKWALSDELIAQIEQVAQQLAPEDSFNLYQHLFTDCDFDLYEKSGDWEEQQKKLNERRGTAISEIFQQNGIEGVIRFAESVSSPRKVGFALGAIPDPVIEKTLLPRFLDSADDKHKTLVSSFIWRRCHLKGWEWCDRIDTSDWTPAQVGQFLACLPFTKEAWDRASTWLQIHESEYWTRTSANAYQTDNDLTIAVEKLIEHGRPCAAIGCLDRMLHDKQQIDTNQCVRALLAALSSSESKYTIDGYHIVELIKFLQSEPTVNQDDLFRVEWAYLPLLDWHSGAAPKLLESRLANVPEFFCEVIRLIYRSKKEDQPPRETTEESRAIATNAWRLLYKWRTPPGTQEDGTFSEERFTEWLQRVKEICTESGHLEVALVNIGKVLIYTPPDPDGLWIRRAVAAALNDREVDDMRAGFSTGTYNSRGVHWVDPTGKPERELAEQFRRKAEEIENAGFHRFAVTLRELAGVYDREAERIVAEHREEES
jgi:hypothetical protein